MFNTKISKQNLTEGFRWSNFDLGVWSTLENKSTAVTPRREGLQWQWNRRASKTNSKDRSDAAVDPSAEHESLSGSSCSFQDIAPQATTMVTCGVSLMLVSCSRHVAGLIVVRSFRLDDLPAMLLFPCWEGPVVLVQYLALCDSAMSAASLLCPAGISLGVLVLMLGPISFLVLAARYIRGHMRDSTLEFEVSPAPSLKEFRGKISAVKGLVGKLVTAHAYFGSSLSRGQWKASRSQAYWGFLTSSFVGTCIGYLTIVLRTLLHQTHQT